MLDTFEQGNIDLPAMGQQQAATFRPPDGRGVYMKNDSNVTP